MAANDLIADYPDPQLNYDDLDDVVDTNVGADVGALGTSDVSVQSNGDNDHNDHNGDNGDNGKCSPVQQGENTLKRKAPEVDDDAGEAKRQRKPEGKLFLDWRKLTLDVLRQIVTFSDISEKKSDNTEDNLGLQRVFLNYDARKYKELTGDNVDVKLAGSYGWITPLMISPFAVKPAEKNGKIMIGLAVAGAQIGQAIGEEQQAHIDWIEKTWNPFVHESVLANVKRWKLDEEKYNSSTLLVHLQPIINKPKKKDEGKGYQKQIKYKFDTAYDSERKPIVGEYNIQVFDEERKARHVTEIDKNAEVQVIGSVRQLWFQSLGAINQRLVASYVLFKNNPVVEMYEGCPFPSGE